MRKSSILQIVSGALILALVLCMAVMPAFAEQHTYDAKEVIDPSRLCTLTVDCQGVEGTEVKLYWIASVRSDFIYVPTPEFSRYSLNLNSVASAEEWDGIRETIASYIVADDIEQDYISQADSEGKAQFTGLTPGLYYGEVAENDAGVFTPFLMLVPTLDDETGLWQYDAEVAPWMNIASAPVSSLM